MGYVDNDEDCDDDEASSNPDASERCDGADNDCDGEVDEDALDAEDWYPDEDGDGYGDSSATAETSCMEVSGLVSNGSDCDDDDADISPDATEICDGVDNDCNDEIDDAEDATTWYRDFDEDGYGDDDTSTDSCDNPDGYVAENGDCNDADETIHPDADEPCDEIDNNSNDEIDELGATTYYVDSDGDGYGDDDTAEEACGEMDGTPPLVATATPTMRTSTPMRKKSAMK